MIKFTYQDHTNNFNPIDTGTWNAPITLHIDRDGTMTATRAKKKLKVIDCGYQGDRDTTALVIDVSAICDLKREEIDARYIQELVFDDENTTVVEHFKGEYFTLPNTITDNFTKGILVYRLRERAGDENDVFVSSSMPFEVKPSLKQFITALAPQRINNEHALDIHKPAILLNWDNDILVPRSSKQLIGYKGDQYVTQLNIKPLEEDGINYYVIFRHCEGDVTAYVECDTTAQTYIPAEVTSHTGF